MNFKLLITLLMISSAYAKITINSSGMVQPFSKEKVELKAFTVECAKVLDKRMTFTNHTFKNQKATITTAKPITKKKLISYLAQALTDARLSLISEGSGFQIIPTRKISEHVFDLKQSDNFDAGPQVTKVMHKMSYPLAREFKRVARRSLTRRGKISTIAEKILLIQDSGQNVANIIAMAKEMDTQQSYDNYLNRRKKEQKRKSSKSYQEREVAKLKKENRELKDTSKKLEKASKELDKAGKELSNMDIKMSSNEVMK